MTAAVAIFDQEIDATTATAATFVVSGDQSGKITGSTLALNDPDAIRFTADSRANPGEVIRVTATDQIQSTDGVSNQPYVWEFREGVVGGSAEFVDNAQTLGSDNTHGTAIGDLDGDGDLDIFAANYNELLGGAPQRVWFNYGDGTFYDSGQELGDHNSRDVTLGDVDDDGDLDAFVANYPSQANRIWINTGGNFSDSGQAIGSASTWSIELGDVDGDGDQDALAANGYADNRLYQNDAGIFTDTGQAIGSNSSNLKLGDLDGDGDLDVFAVSRGSGSQVWLNNSEGVFADSGQSLGTYLDEEVVLADMDNDGDLDAVTSTHLWLNDGSAGFTDGGSTGGSLDPIAVGDLDDDGDLDLLNSDAGKTYIQLNDGGVFTSGGYVDNGGSSIEVGDLDSDGALDFFVGVGNLPDGAFLNQSYTVEFDDSSVDVDEDSGFVPQLLVRGSFDEAETVKVTVVGGTATTDLDFTNTEEVTIPAGVYDGTLDTAVPINLEIIDDALVEDIETINLSLTDPSGALQVNDANLDGRTYDSLDISIYDDDSPDEVVVEFDTANASDLEATGGNLPQLLVRGTLADAVTVDVTVVGGSATSGDDFVNTATVTISAGTYDGMPATAVAINLSIADDELVEGDEMIDLELASPSGVLTIGDANSDATIQSAHTYTISNDDEVVVEFDSAAENDLEASGGNLPQLLVRGTLAVAVTVDVTVIGGSATSGDDFFNTATVAISAGTYDGTSATAVAIDLSIADDELVEGDETIDLELGAPSGVLAIGDADGDSAIQDIHTYTIVDDDSSRPTIETLLEMVDELPLGGGQLMSLRRKLLSAQQALLDGDRDGAVEKLQEFKKQLQTFVRVGFLTFAEAQPTIDAACDLIEAIESSSTVFEAIDVLMTDEPLDHPFE